MARQERETKKRRGGQERGEEWKGEEDRREGEKRGYMRERKKPGLDAGLSVRLLPEAVCLLEVAEDRLECNTVIKGSGL